MAKRTASEGVKSVWRVLNDLMVPGSKVQGSVVRNNPFYWFDWFNLFN